MTERLLLRSPADAGAFLARVVRLDPAALIRLRPYGEGTVALWTWLTVGALAVRVVPGTGPDDAVVAASALLDAIGADAPRPDAPRLDAPVPDLGGDDTGGGEKGGAQTGGGETGGADITLPPRRDSEWRGPLPGTGFRRLDELPAEVVASLAAAGERTFREAAAGRSRSGARAVTDAVLDHVAVAVTGPAALSALTAGLGPAAPSGTGPTTGAGPTTLSGPTRRAASTPQMGPTTQVASTAQTETAEVPQRAIQALSSLGFLGTDPVAVDVTPAWLRLVGTYGAVHLRRGTGLGVLAR